MYDQDANAMSGIPGKLDGFDVGSAVARMLDRSDLWWQALGMFVEHFSGWESAWRLAVGDDAAERKLVHALRSAAGNVGATDVARMAERLEKALLRRQAGDSVDIPRCWRDELAESCRHALAIARAAGAGTHAEGA